MIPQLSLAYRPAHAGAETWDVEREAIRAAVSYLGAKEVAYELDISGSALSDALNERDSAKAPLDEIQAFFASFNFDERD